MPTRDAARSPGNVKPLIAVPLQLSRIVEVPIYNSTSVLDDMAWGAVWLHMATGDPTYLGQAQRYIGRHYQVCGSGWGEMCVPELLCSTYVMPRYADGVRESEADGSRDTAYLPPHTCRRTLTWIPCTTTAGTTCRTGTTSHGPPTCCWRA